MGGDKATFTVVASSGDIAKRKGFFLSRGVSLILVIVVALLVIVTAVIAVHVAKDRVIEGFKAAQRKKGSTTGPTSPAVTSEPGLPTPSAEPTTAGPEPYWKIRLPGHVVPLRYNVTLDVDMKRFTFTGATVIRINVTSTTSEYILVHVDNMMSVAATLTDMSGRDIPIVKQFEFKKNQFYVMKFNKPVAAGIYNLHFKHHSMLALDLKGFYKSSYRRNGVEHFIAVTQFAPTDCRRAFPSFDEPAMKSVFKLTLIHDPKYLAVSNMPLVSTSTLEQRQRDEFAISVRMSTYLVVFVIGEFGSDVRTAAGVDMTFYAVKDQVEQLQVAAQAGTQILPFFQDFFNTTYALAKADMMAIPDFSAGAMENWGLITYRETTLLYKNGQSSESNRQRIVTVVSHELAHQWFGNLVTMDWWSDVWLNEGFASYVEYLGVDHVQPSWKVNDQFVVMDQNTALGLDSLVTSHPVYVEAQTPNEINELFDTISYSKGCSILRMLNDFIGMAHFRQGLTGYLKKYAYGNAKTSDLWNSLAEVTTGQYDVGKIMDSWTLQMGYPVVTVTRTATGFKLSQQRFLADKDADSSKSKYVSSYGYLWYVPFKYERFTPSGVSQGIHTIWMNITKEVAVTADVANDILKGNAGQNGFYRVNYESSEWTKISDALKANFSQFSVADRAGLIGDAFALASAHVVTYKTALDLLDYIDRETEYVPWAMASGKIDYLNAILGKSSQTYKYLKKYMLKKIARRYSEIDFSKSETDQLTIFMRSSIVGIACRYGSQGCLGNASKMFTDWKDHGKSIDPSFRSLVYFYGIFNGGEAEWDFAFKKSQETNVASERSSLLYGLSASQEPWIIDRYLKYSLNQSYIKSQDAPTVFRYICQSGPIGSLSAWNFFTSNWGTIRSRFGSGIFLMRNFIVAVSASLSNQYELDQFDTFFNNVGDLGTVARAVTQAREGIVARMTWRKSHESVVRDWLSNNYA